MTMRTPASLQKEHDAAIKLFKRAIQACLILDELGMSGVLDSEPDVYKRSTPRSPMLTRCVVMNLWPARR